MSPLTLKKSRASKGSVSKVSLDRRRQERMCSGDALATPHFAQTGKTLLPWLKEQLLRKYCIVLYDSYCQSKSKSDPFPQYSKSEYLKPFVDKKGAADICAKQVRYLAPRYTTDKVYNEMDYLLSI
ncbi:hypothetical protein AVEN_157781-1 [Araneus ventricosus]|uniref:Uncharacterized protein n=1 Tax=Araneus ventricosus TaxID=182803 RepID=A0A4Y2VIT7_ARAVE|nr:hypothetical protein AVEN_157781-1 [Araneus ventricosus]